MIQIKTALKETQEVADKYKEKWGVNFKVSSINKQERCIERRNCCCNCY